MKDAVTFALVLLAAMWAENIPLLLVLTVAAWVVQGHRKTAPRGANSESGRWTRKVQKNNLSAVIIPRFEGDMQDEN